jgi:hypothetical protein
MENPFLHLRQERRIRPDLNLSEMPARTTAAKAPVMPIRNR